MNRIKIKKTRKERKRKKKGEKKERNKKKHRKKHYLDNLKRNISIWRLVTHNKQNKQVCIWLVNVSYSPV